MTGESDSSSADSVDYTKHKKHKMSKSKKEKKAKKHKIEKEKKSHKKKKRARRDSSSDESLATYVSEPVALPPRIIDNENDADDTFGPALPPHLLKKSDPLKDNAQQPAIIGPVMPSTYKNVETQPELNNNAATEELMAKTKEEDDDLAECFGPLPASSVESMTAQQVELEQRALELKIAAIAGDTLNMNSDQTVREEWMLELPEVGLKSGLAALANMKRTFHQGKERPDFSDRSSWTKTPQSEASDKQNPKSSKNIAQEAQEQYARQRDAEQESIAKKHKKKHKREESLVELHQKKLRKEQRKKEKELAATGAKPERRPFTRDVDLKLNKIDKNQTKQIVDKAKILDSKFSSGHTKYL